MKKRFVIAGATIVAAGVLAMMLIPRAYEKKVVVNTPFLLLYKQISVIGNYAKWYRPFTGSDSSGITISGNNKISKGPTSLQIDVLNERSCVLRVTENDHSVEILYNITADTVNKNSVTLLYKASLWQKLTGTNKIFDEAEKSLTGLKDYTEDTRRVYGFPISLVLVIDTTFLFTAKTVALSSKQQSIKELYRELINYAAAKDAGYTGTNIFYITAEGKDSVRLYQGIGISKNVLQLPLYGPISVKRMPYKKNLVMAAYKGRFGDIPAVFSALEQFSIDNSMISMAIPFLKFESGENDFDDEKIISANAYFPVR